MSDFVIVNGELYHHGVKGMKWGVRKKYKDRYKSAKKTFKEAGKQYRNDTKGLNLGIKGIAKVQAANKRYRQAEMDFVSEKVKYKTAKAKDPKKAEMKAYVKEMSKNGLPGSYADLASQSRSSDLYKRIKTDKGKAYADTVMKKTQNRAYATMAASAAVAVGATAAQIMLATRNY